MAGCAWYCCPYDMKKTSLIADIARHRLIVNHVLALGYVGFWHVVLYIFHICHRPFVPNRTYNLDKVLHNAFYTWLGVLHWTATELAFIYCYRTGRLNYMGDMFQSPSTAVQALVLCVLVPPYRDVHFYFCHRMIHIRFLYKYVHSVHHRNTDIEPFAGLSMHPVEHLYYFTCYGPFLVLAGAPPFALFWMGFHTALSPAASHSGWEDHFSADLAHYLHHRYCECNYSGGINFDRYFGTYQATLRSTRRSTAKVASSATKSSASGEDDAIARSQPPLDTKATLAGVIPEYPAYQMGLLLVCGGSVMAFRHGFVGPGVTAALLSMGPAILALLLALATRPASLSIRKVLLAPFDKDPIWSLCLHIGLGFFLGVLPAMYLLNLVLSPVGGGSSS
jgi:sterol desaturase/sphingolipid hydroxylase (fatty acid hydroxylase superfamily)